MIGYLLCEPKNILESFKPPHQWRSKTWKVFLDEEYSNIRLLLFKNENPNNYLVNSIERLILVTGTIVCERKRGLDAVKEISEKLSAGNQIEKIYDECFGCFNLLVLNKKLCNAILVTDREGMQGAFLYNRKGQCMISSNLLMLAAISGVGLDPVGSCEYLHLGHSFEWRTIFNEIERIRGGTKIYNDRGGWKTKRIWKIQVAYPYSLDSDKDIIEKVSSLIGDSVDAATENLHKPVGVDLTGGTDSRTVLSFCLKNMKEIEVTTAGPATHIDVVISSNICRKMGLPFFWYEDRPVDKKNIDQLERAIEYADGTLAVMSVLKKMPYYATKARKYEIMLGGCGGGFFKDQFWLYDFNRINRLREPNWSRVASLSSTDWPLYDQLTPSLKKGICDHCSSIFYKYSSEVSGTNNQKLDYVNYHLKFPNEYGPQFGLTNQYLDLYHPLVDGRIIQYVINSKPSIRKWNNLEYSLIINNDKKLAWIPTDDGNPAVPSIGKNIYLRSYLVIQYARAAMRKFRMLGLRKDAIEQPHVVGNIIETVQGDKYWDILDFNVMRLSGLIDKYAFNKIKARDSPSGYKNYLSTIISIELSCRRTEELRKEILY